MRSAPRRLSRGLATAIAVAGLLAPAAAAAPPVHFQRIDGYAAPGTPAQYNRVGILKTGSPRARNILVLNPGTSASAAYFEPLAKDIVSRAKGWQVWAVERRENLLEDQSMVDLVKQGRATTQQLFDYYLGYITDRSITHHFQSIPDSAVGFAHDWGMHVEIADLRRVVLLAERQGGHVVVGGHSLGGTITTAYATWDFNGQPGARGLSGLVYIDGASNPTPVTPAAATQSLQSLQAGSPWLSFGGIVAPFAGLFNVVSATTVHLDPNGVGGLQSFAGLPANLRPPVPTTNIAAYGYALDTKTSPATLKAAQAHLGQLAASGDPRGWDSTGALTPIQRFADMFSGTGLMGFDGTAWYHPLRLTIDAGAVAEGNANPAQSILDVHTTDGHRLPHRLRMYAFGAALGGPTVPAATTLLAQQSGIPLSHVVGINRQSTYAHNDPSGAAPGQNAFLAGLVPFLNRIARGR